MINPRISAVWSTTKPIAALSCTPRVQLEYSQSEYSNLIGERLVSISRRTQVRQ